MKANLAVIGVCSPHAPLAETTHLGDVVEAAGDS